jgi:hypothetical protein
LPAATQSVLDAHDTALSPPVAPPTALAVHVGAAAVGFVEVRISPAWSTATHRALDGHEIPCREPVSAKLPKSNATGADQLDGAALADDTKPTTSSAAAAATSQLFHPASPRITPLSSSSYDADPHGSLIFGPHRLAVQVAALSRP